MNDVIYVLNYNSIVFGLRILSENDFEITENKDVYDADYYYFCDNYHKTVVDYKYRKTLYQNILYIQKNKVNDL